MFLSGTACDYHKVSISVKGRLVGTHRIHFHSHILRSEVKGPLWKWPCQFQNDHASFLAEVLISGRQLVRVEWVVVVKFKQNLYLFRGRFTESNALFFRNALITFTQLHIHTWKLPSTTTVWSAGHWAAPLERLGLSALLKGTSVVVMREGQALLFTFPTQIYPAGPVIESGDLPVWSSLL